VGLAGATLESAGISTVAIQFAREAAADARPPRAIFAPFRYGFPTDPENEAGRLHSVMEAALSALESEERPPLLVEWRPPAKGGMSRGPAAPHARRRDEPAD
jgi:hypothetical protein